MNIVKKYLDLTGQSQKALTNELKKINKNYDKFLISKMANGVIEPNQEITNYLEAKIKVVATNFKGDKKQNRVIIPIDNKNRLKTKIETQIFELLPMSRKDLVKTTGLRDESVRQTINIMRDNGIRIISKNGVYKVAESDEEFMDYKNRYLSYAFTMLKRWNAMENNNEGQMSYE